MQQTIAITVQGKVQGVYFRKHTLNKALSLGLTGFVKNKADGTVSIEASGDPEQLQALADWCKQGSPGSVVTAVHTSNLPFTQYDSFRIER